MCLLSQGRTAFAPCFYEIKERDLTLCACQLKGKQFCRSTIEVKDEQLPLSIKTEYGQEMAYIQCDNMNRKGRIQVDTLDLDWLAHLLRVVQYTQSESSRATLLSTRLTGSYMSFCLDAQFGFLHMTLFKMCHLSAQVYRTRYTLHGFLFPFFCAFESIRVVSTRL